MAAAVELPIYLLTQAKPDAPTLFTDCMWSAEGKAFQDLNSNGLFEAAEPPLQGAVFHVDDTLNGMISVNDRRGVSDAEGLASLFIWLPGCPDTAFEVYTDTPPGYQLTTAPRMRPGKDDLPSYTFGYKPLP